MHLIVYSSQVMDAGSDVTGLVRDIVASAESKNPSLSVTGVLLFENKHFLQAIEGEETVLRELFETIRGDERHGEITVHVDQNVEERAFSNWSMESFNIENAEIFSSGTIDNLYAIFNRSFPMNSRNLITFIKEIVDEIDVYKIKSAI
ncbi:MAG: BLUF domain-containing protein [Pseudomonadota bacterium]